MTRFNPGKHKSENQSDDSEWLTVAGDFSLVLTSLKRDHSKSGKPFLLMMARVIHGPHKGKKFFQRFYLNPEAQWKLADTCCAMRTEEELSAFEFDLGNDRECRQALLNIPFRAQVECRHDGNRTYAEIRRTTPLKDLPQAQRDFFDQWTAEHQAQASTTGGFDEPHPADFQDDGFGGEDDIPF